jgi:hypothetical protein
MVVEHAAVSSWRSRRRLEPEASVWCAAEGDGVARTSAFPDWSLGTREKRPRSVRARLQNNGTVSVAPKAWNKVAWGNAPGLAHDKRPALTGRDKQMHVGVVPPCQGLAWFRDGAYPGRCPGLPCFAPLGLGNVPSRGGIFGRALSWQSR